MPFFDLFRKKSQPEPTKPAKPAKPKLSLEFPEGNHFTKGSNANVKGRIFVAKSSKNAVSIGTGNVVSIGDGSTFSGTIEIIGDNNKIIIGENCTFKGDIVVKGKGQTVTFGDHSTTVGVYLLSLEGCDISIGKWCMFSREIEIRTSDAHSVIDRATGKRLNKPTSISIGDHVWVGVGAIINKGSVIPSDSIVGAMSFVNGTFDEEGVVIAGMPAKIVRRGITWNRSRRAKFTDAEMDHWRE